MINTSLQDPINSEDAGARQDLRQGGHKLDNADLQSQEERGYFPSLFSIKGKFCNSVVSNKFWPSVPHFVLRAMYQTGVISEVWFSLPLGKTAWKCDIEHNQYPTDNFSLLSKHWSTWCLFSGCLLRQCLGKTLSSTASPNLSHSRQIRYISHERKSGRRKQGLAGHP